MTFVPITMAPASLSRGTIGASRRARTVAAQRRVEFLGSAQEVFGDFDR
jgi:hypothetical protein